MQKNEKNLFWLKLDNAGKIFPAQNTATWSNVIRMTLVMKETVDPELLAQALEDIMPRFPCFDVRLRNGFFWSYLQQNPKTAPPVMPDINNPCVRMKWKENDGFLFRVFYHENRISVEFFHAITDGYGMTCFIMTLAARYLALRGIEIPVGGAILDINEKATEDEISDAFLKFGNSKGKPLKNQKGVYHCTGTRLPIHTVSVITGYMSVAELKAKSKEYGVTMTEFLASLALYIVYMQQLKDPKNKQKPVSVQIPMNGRRKMDTKTLRNFSLPTCVTIDPKLGEYTFEEILKLLALRLRYANTEKNFRATIKNNVDFEKNPFVRFTPILLKNVIVSTMFTIKADDDTSVLVSNLGPADVPDEMTEHITQTIVMSSPGRKTGAKCAVSSIGDNLSFTFIDIFKETDIEREFFTSLVKMGIHVKVESNKI